MNGIDPIARLTGSIALVLASACGADGSSGPDANRPTDAARARADAARPGDAAPLDGAAPIDAPANGPSDAAPADGPGPDAAPEIVPCLIGGNVAYFDGSEDDYVHPGTDTISWGRWWGSGLPEEARVSMTPYDPAQGTYWGWVFRSLPGYPLEVGVYEGAVRATGADPTHPGLDVDGDGRGCNTLTGRFRIHQIDRSAELLTGFTASFEQHCEGTTAVLRGCVHFEFGPGVADAGPPPDDAGTTDQPLTVGVVGPGSVYSWPPALGCPPTCSASFPLGSIVTAVADPYPGFSLSGWSGDCVGLPPCSVTMSSPRSALATFVASPAPNVTWARTFAAAGVDDAAGVAITGGDVIVVGGFLGTIDFGGTSMSSLDADGDLFVARYDGATGDLEWVRQAGVAARAAAVAVDSAGDVLVAGSFAGTLDLDGSVVSSVEGSSDTLVAKLDGDTGVASWATGFGGPAGDEGASIAVDGVGDVLVGGRHDGTMTVAGTELTGYEAFVVKLDGVTGTPTWATAVDGGDGVAADSLAVDSSGDVVVAGNPGALPFLAAFDGATGAGRWTVNMTGEGATVGAVLVSAAGVLVAGGFEGTVDFGGIELSAEYGDAFVARYDVASGAVESVVAPAADSGTIDAAALTDDGDLVVAGGYDEHFDFGVTGLPTFGGRDIYVARLAGGDFSPRWVHGFGAAYASGVGVDTDGNVAVVGQFGDDFTAGSESVTGTGTPDGYLFELAP